MPRVSENRQIVEIIMTFMDELVEKYTVFEEVKIDATSTSLYGGYKVESNQSEPNIGFRFEGFFIERKDFKNYIEVFIESQNTNYPNPRGDELFKIIMRFMDDFFENHLVLENKKEKVDSNIQRSGYRPTKERIRNNISYQLSGVVPSRDEIDSQIKAFIQIKNL